MMGRNSFFIKLFIGLCVSVCLFFYFFHQSRAFLLGPQIAVRSPENGETLSKSIVFVNGSAVNTDSLLLNDRPIITDSFGNFEEQLILTKGYNIIELTAKDKFGRKVNKKIEIVNK
ncbi:hypothetical protein KKA27_01865 [Patescibacteria group bacterium]|nr:hypothetical protein [Patescibacteria group bacterium]MBU2633196.1 hypothetical protein [Patescibacteria group bacterium]